MTHGSLFSGIGGFDLGFERAGIETVWQVEIDPYCRKVLEKHWPHVQRFSDIKECVELPSVDVVTGGFPCQDISQAGYKVGIEGARSGLWSEMYRIIGSIRPRFIVMENVAALLDRGMGRVQSDLAAAGYDTEWSVISACQFGFTHPRERVFTVAYPPSFGLEREGEDRSDGKGLAQWLPSEAAKSEMRSRFRQAPPSSAMGVVNGFPHWMDRITHLGNAVVPQIAEWIGRRILEAEKVNHGE